MNYLLILFLSILFISPCNKEKADSDNPEKEASSRQGDVKTLDASKITGTVFLGKVIEGRLVIEDNKTYTENIFSWAKDTLESYDAYYDYLKSAAKKYADYKDDKPGYYFGKYPDEFGKLTKFKPGDKVYISAKSGVFPGEIKGYYMNFDDIIGSGVVFYAVAESPDYKPDDDEMFICSADKNMSAFKTVKLSGPGNEGIIKPVKSVILDKVKELQVTDESSGKEKFIKVTAIDTSELVILPGSFTAAGKNEYIAGYTLRQAFAYFAYYIIIVNEKGEFVKEFAGLVQNSFTYETIIGVTDINGDGIYEILTEDGYYEGRGYNLHMLEGNIYKVITSGFFFGV